MPAAGTALDVAYAAAARAPERTKLRWDRTLFISESALNVRSPALLILPAPHLHGLGIALELSVFLVDQQFAIDFPGDFRELQYGDGDVSNSNRSVQFFSRADAGDEVCEMRIGH